MSTSTDRDSTASLGNLFQRLSTLTTQSVFFCVQMEPHVFTSYPVRSCPGSSTTESGSFVFIPSHRLFILIYKIPLKISGLKSPSSLGLSSHGRWSSPLIIFMTIHWTWPSISTSHVLGGPELDPTLQVWLYQCWAGGEGWPPMARSHGSPLLNAAQDAAGKHLEISQVVLKLHVISIRFICPSFRDLHLG